MIHAKVLWTLGTIGLALAGLEVYKKVKYPVGGIAPPGTAQDPGTVVSLPGLPAMSAAQMATLQMSAASLLQSLNTGGLVTTSTSPVLAFQSTWNASGGLALQTDGIYGSKTQAALQTVIAPAVAPSNILPAQPPVSLPAAVVPAVSNPLPDVLTAANAILTDYPSGGDRTSTQDNANFQTAWNQLNPATHLTVDGLYGPLTAAALQSVLNNAGTGQTAPGNAYGAVGAIPAYPGSTAVATVDVTITGSATVAPTDTTVDSVISSDTPADDGSGASDDSDDSSASG